MLHDAVSLLSYFTGHAINLCITRDFGEPQQHNVITEPDDPIRIYDPILTA